MIKSLGILLTKTQKNILRFLLATTFCYMWANYSIYYIKNMEVYMMLASIFILLTIGRSMMDLKEAIKLRPLYFVAFIIYFVITFFIHGEQPSVGVISALLMGCLMLSLKRIFKIWLYERFITILAYLLGISIIEFLLATLFGISYINGTPIYRFEQDAHFFFPGIINIFPGSYQTGYARFQAFTEEPGLVGTLCAFLLACIDIEKNKWQTFVFIISGILSMSLAFYLMFVLWIIYIMVSIKNIKIKILLIFFLGGISFFIQDVATELIGGRLNNKTSIVDLDNRGTYTFKKEFNEYIVTTDAILGRGLRTFHSTFTATNFESGGNAGAKPFIYSYGLFSMILLFIFYNRCFLKVNGATPKAFFILFIFWISFYQREYWYTPYNIVPLFMYGIYNQYIQSVK